MYLKTLVETNEGEVEFTANLAPEETKFLLEYAINSLMQQGALPFVRVNGEHEVAIQSMEKQ